jgi:hypothetical protein
MPSFQTVKFVSPLQIYLDLQGLPGRGREAASEIFNRFLAVGPRDQKEGSIIKLE